MEHPLFSSYNLGMKLRALNWFIIYVLGYVNWGQSQSFTDITFTLFFGALAALNSTWADGKPKPKNPASTIMKIVKAWPYIGVAVFFIIIWFGRYRAHPVIGWVWLIISLLFVVVAYFIRRNGPFDPDKLIKRG